MCLQEHNHLSANYQLCLISAEFGDADQCIASVRALMLAEGFDLAISNRNNYLQKMSGVLVEGGLYEDAVELLSDLINEDPENSEARFLRAVSFFELGAFELAAEDFEYVTIESSGDQEGHAPEGFTSAFLSSLRDGTKEAALDFVPSLCHSVRGIGCTLWAVASRPVDSCTEFAQAAYSVAEYTVDILRSLDAESLERCGEAVAKLGREFKAMSAAEKGEMIGYMIGRYGTDILIGGAAFKGVRALQNLKKLNRVCNLQALTVSEASKRQLIAQSIRHEARRTKFFQQTRIHWDSQGKHVPGHKNFLAKRSQVTVPEETLEKLVKQKAGSGKQIPGTELGPGYRERVDFGVVIGKYSDITVDGAHRLSDTQMGIIHYSKKGAHVVPSQPL